MEHGDHDWQWSMVDMTKETTRRERERRKLGKTKVERRGPITNRQWTTVDCSMQLEKSACVYCVEF